MYFRITARIHFRRPVCVLCLCFVLALFCIESVFPPWSEAVGIRDTFSNGQSVTVTGTLKQIEHKNYTTALYLSDVIIDRGEGLPVKCGGLIAYPEDDKTGGEYLKLGARLVVRGSYSPFDEAQNYGNFDAFRYYAVRRIDGKIKKAYATT